MAFLEGDTWPEDALISELGGSPPPGWTGNHFAADYWDQAWRNYLTGTAAAPEPTWPPYVDPARPPLPRDATPETYWLADGSMPWGGRWVTPR